jgi:L-cystine transport system substrate-binding protein
MLRKKVGSMVLAALIASVLLSFGLNEGVAWGAPQEAPTGKTKILVGTSGLIYPVTFYDEDNKLTGVDVVLTEEIFKRLPEYEYEWYVADLATLFIAVDTNKIQMIAHNIGKNPERLAKYL